MSALGMMGVGIICGLTGATLAGRDSGLAMKMILGVGLYVGVALILHSQGLV